MSLFGTAGARGPYPSKISPKLVYDIALAAAKLVGGGHGSAVVGYDTRLTSPLLSLMAASGFMAGGMDAIIIDVAPLPVVGFAIRHSRSRVGASISASHNPPTDNGIKLLKSEGLELFREEELELEKLIGSVKEVEWSRAGTFTQSDETRYYIASALERVDTDKWDRSDLRVMVDCANGAASMVTPQLLTKAGLSHVFTVNCHPDGRFPGRLPEPRQDIMKALEPVLNSSGADFMLAHDGDADRLAVIDRGLGFVKQDLVIALLARRALRDRKGRVVVSVDVGYEVQEVVEELGGELVRAPLGRLHEYVAKDSDVIMASEPWKLIDPSWGLWPDGIYQALLIVDEVIKSGKSFHDLVLELPSYPSARISFKIASDSDKSALYARLSEKAEELIKGAKVTNLLTIDGVRVDADDGSWILLRQSGTETKVRLYMQAKTAARLVEIINHAKEAVMSESEKLNIKVLDVEEAIDLRSSST